MRQLKLENDFINHIDTYANSTLQENFKIHLLENRKIYYIHT